MESDLPTAQRKARWNKDFDAKGHIRQTRLSRGEPFLVQNAKGGLCYAVVGGTIELHGQAFATVQGVPAKVATRDKISIDANTRPGRAVKGSMQSAPEAMSKWSNTVEEVEGDTSTEIGGAVGRKEYIIVITVPESDLLCLCL